MDGTGQLEQKREPYTTSRVHCLAENIQNTLLYLAQRSSRCRKRCKGMRSTKLVQRQPLNGGSFHTDRERVRLASSNLREWPPLESYQHYYSLIFFVTSGQSLNVGVRHYVAAVL